MKKNKINLIVINLLFVFILKDISYAEKNFFIVTKVDNEIITNVDIMEEKNYLISLNNDLEKIDKDSLINIAKNSLIREKIKKIELNKYHNSSLVKNDVLDSIIENFYKKLNLNNINEFRGHLKSYGLNLSIVEEKITTEILWNQYIYNKYANLLNINIEKLKKKVKDDKYSNNKVTQYLLSEILFIVNNKAEFEKTNSEIREKIKVNGFKTAANIYSVSDTAKFGGRVGLINEKQLSEKILEEIKSIQPGELTNTIDIPNGYLILKLEDIVSKEIKKDLKVELDNLVRFETDRQLNQFSIIHYNKIKLNSKIVNE